MKKDIVPELIKVLAKMENLKYESDKFYQFDEEKFVWCPYSKKEIRSNLFEALSKVETTLNAYTIDRLVKEVMIRPEFYAEISQKVLTESRIHVGADMLDLSGDKILITPAKKGDFSVEALDFQFKPGAKLSDAPTWLGFLATTFGIEANLNLQSMALENEAAKVLAHSSVKRLLEFLGYAVAPPGIWGAKKMMVLLGPPNTGKSQILEVVRRVKGNRHIVPMSPADLADRFRSGLLQDAALLINDELPTAGLKHLDILKKTIAGEPLPTEKKGRDAIVSRPHVKMLFGGNQLPALAEPDYGDAFASRLSVVCFPKSVEEDQRDVHLADKLFAERDVIFSLCMKELQQMIRKNYQFTPDAAGDEAVRVYKSSNSSFAEFIDPKADAVEVGVAHYVRAKDIYEAYTHFCDENAFVPCGKTEFKERMRQEGFAPDKGRKPEWENKPLAYYHGIRLKGIEVA